EEPQPLLGTPGRAMRLDEALRHEREVGRVLGLDALPVRDRLLEIALLALEVAEEQARAYALAVRLECRFEVAARRVGVRARRLRGRELAVILGERARLGIDQARHLDCARP